MKIAIRSGSEVGGGGELWRLAGHFLKCDQDVVESVNFQTLIGGSTFGIFFKSV